MTAVDRYPHGLGPQCCTPAEAWERVEGLTALALSEDYEARRIARRILPRGLRRRLLRWLLRRRSSIERWTYLMRTLMPDDLYGWHFLPDDGLRGLLRGLLRGPRGLRAPQPAQRSRGTWRRYCARN